MKHQAPDNLTCPAKLSAVGYSDAATQVTRLRRVAAGGSCRKRDFPGGLVGSAPSLRRDHRQNWLRT
jgi:hypothetical protein